MHYSNPPFPALRSLSGLAIAVALHVLLLLGWHYGRRAQVPELPADSGAMFVVQAPVYILPRPPTQLGRPARTAKADAQAKSGAQTKASLQATAARASETPAEAITPPAAPPAPAADAPAAARSAADIMQQARHDLGKIDKDLRGEFPGARITAPVSTAQTRLEQGFDRAAAAMPNRWYEAPKVTEIQDPGGYGRRRYRVVGAKGTYCITMESNHAPDGIDTMIHGIKPKKTNCYEHEQEATHQKWNDARAPAKSSVIAKTRSTRPAFP
ncbi:MAG: hypothetical protein V4857_21985 [Pseudomonadota bacterium]